MVAVVVVVMVVVVVGFERVSIRAVEAGVGAEIEGVRSRERRGVRWART
jgi:hypothetical protein